MLAAKGGAPVAASAHPADLRLWLVSVLLIAGIVVVSDVRGVDLRRATDGGPLGTPPDPTPRLVDRRTVAGLVVRQPAGGADQCWQAVLCVPQLKVRSLAMRGSTIGDGFKAATSLSARGAG